MRRSTTNLAFLALATESQFYVLAPLLMFLRGRRAGVVLLLMLLASAVVRKPHGGLYWALRPDAFLLGMALYRVHAAKPNWRLVPDLSPGLVAFWLLVAALIARMGVGVGAFSGFAWTSVAVISAGIVAGRVSAVPMAGTLGAATRAIGRGSFSVYLVHLPIIAWTASLAPRLGVAISVAASLVMIALASCLLELAVSRPAARFGRAVSEKLLTARSSEPSGGRWIERTSSCREPSSSASLPA